jgi:hypothetical protein
MDHNNIDPFLLKPKHTIDCSPQNIRKYSNIFPLGQNQFCMKTLRKRFENDPRAYNIFPNLTSHYTSDPKRKHLIKTHPTRIK